MSVEARFWAKVDRRDPDECWEWTGARNPSGHGRFAPHHKNTPAHRWAYEALVGPVPADRPHLDHLCEHPWCVNPKHLEPTTIWGNLSRSRRTPAVINAHKTHCPQGHPYDEQNTYISARGSRACRTCLRDRARLYYARKNAS